MEIKMSTDPMTMKWFDSLNNIISYLRAILLTRINFNPAMYK